jgi:putative ABC transport system permease protein
VIKDAPGVARENGSPVASAELFVIINIPKRSTGTDANVPFRGIEASRSGGSRNIQIVQGRMFESGRNEVIAGVNAAREFAGLDVGNTIKLGRTEWHVVGLFSAGGGGGESEMWTDTTVLQSAYQRRDSCQAVHAKLASPDKFQDFKDALTPTRR